MTGHPALIRRHIVTLELFGCEGGATTGYMDAGHIVYVVDSDANRLKRNPANGGTRVDDAMDVLTTLLNGGGVNFRTPDGRVVTLTLEDIDFIHASPPCQYYTRGNAPLRVMRAAGEEPPDTLGGWPRLIPTLRGLLNATRKPWVIENVEDAAWDMRDPVKLCGCMFSLQTDDDDGTRLHLKRPRMFETGGGLVLAAPRECDHAGIVQWAGAYGGARRDKHEARHVRKGGYVPPNKAVVADLLGVRHEMTWTGLFECIPPVYAEHVGRSVEKVG
jgi:DNA (cytosine-5)-methyltransferase 1